MGSPGCSLSSAKGNADAQSDHHRGQLSRGGVRQLPHCYCDARLPVIERIEECWVLYYTPVVLFQSKC